MTNSPTYSSMGLPYVPLGGSWQPQTNQINQTNSTTSASGILPSWLQPSNINSIIGELKNTYGGVAKAFDPTGQVNALQDVIASHNALANQQATATAREYQTRATQMGGSPLGAAVAQGSIMQQADASNANLASQQEQIKSQFAQGALQARSALSDTIDKIRASYSQTLADFYTKQYATTQSGEQFAAGLANQKYQFGQQMNLQQQQFAAQQRQQQIANQLQAAQIYGSNYKAFQPSYQGIQLQPGQDSYAGVGNSFLTNAPTSRFPLFNSF